MTGGRNGSVTSITTDAAGNRTVVVHFPELPAGPGDPPDPPAQDAHDGTYADVSAKWYDEFARVQDSDGALVVDATPANAGTGTSDSISVHKA